VEEERIVGLGALDKPVHRTQNVLLGRLAHRVLLVIGEYDHVFSPIAKVLHEVGCHVANVVDTSPQLAPLTEVVDTNKKPLPSASAVGVPEGVAVGGAVAKLLGPRGRRRRAVRTT
jgi:hypothetical protein